MFSLLDHQFQIADEKSAAKRIQCNFPEQRSREENEIEKPWRLVTNNSLCICWIAKVSKFELKIWFPLENPCFCMNSGSKTPFFSRPVEWIIGSTGTDNLPDDLGFIPNTKEPPMAGEKNTQSMRVASTPKHHQSIGGGWMRSRRKHGFSAEPGSVSAYVGSSKNLKDLKAPRVELHPFINSQPARRFQI